MAVLTLRAKFVLVLVVGAILPLGVVGYWLARSTESSGEELLRARLEASLATVAREVGAQWLVHRSSLLDIAEEPFVQDRLRDGVDLESAAAVRPLPPDAGALFSRYAAHFALVSVRDTAGAVLLEFTPAPGIGAGAARSLAPALPVEVEVHAPLTGEPLGTLGAHVRWSSLLPGSGEPVGVAGSVLAVFDRRTGAPVLAPSIDPALVREPRFELAGEHWVSVARALGEPALDIVLAAPVGPFEQPFAQAARRGTWALLLVALASFLLVSLLTARVTGSLSRLATAADAVAGGDLGQKVSSEGGQELARVAASFNTMTDRLRDTLQELAQRRSLAAVGEFAASLAHEVRNPLSSIRLDLQRARERMGDGADGELVERALRSVERLDRTVTGALTVARSGKVEPRPLDLRAVVAAAARTAEPEFRRREVRLESPPGAEDPIPATGDPAALEQVFLNLLLNAAQASDAGGRATVSVRCDGDHASVTVIDEGAGIPAADRERVFDAFYSTKPEGTGLGLAMARQIVTAHGGEIAVDDRVAGGTAVTVRLPLTRDAPASS